MIFLLFLISLVPLATVWNSGQPLPQGIPFWGPHGHDSIWHLALISQLKNTLTPQNPIFAGVPLTNYHFGFNLFTAFVSNLLPISLHWLYFRIIPLIFSLSVVFLSYSLALKLTKSRLVSFFFSFLNLFAGSAGFVVQLLKNQTLGGESLFWSMQSVSFLLNPPYAFSLVLILIALNLLAYRPKFYLVFTAFIFSLLPIIKIYSFFFLAVFLFLFFIWEIRRHSLTLSNLLPFFLVSIPGVLIIFMSFGLFSSKSLLAFSPLWFSRSLIEAQDKLYLPSLASWRYNASLNLTWWKAPFLAIVELLLILTFLLGNFYTRLLGFFKLRLSSLASMEKALLVSSLVLAVIPLLFIQYGTPWNTIQFLYYSLFVANYFFARYLSRLKLSLALFLLLLSSLTSVSTLKDYFGYPPPAILPASELSALNFLKTLPTGVVLTYPYNPYIKNKLKTPIPLAYYETTAYVSAYSGQVSFLADTMNAQIIGLPVASRQQQVADFFSASSKFEARGFLINNNIDYIYLIPGQLLPLSADILEVSEIYNLSDHKIYQVQK